MGIFGFNFGKGEIKVTTQITEADRKWVHYSFDWCNKKFKKQLKGTLPFNFTQECFPTTFKAKKASPENLLQDLCKLLELEPANISLEYVADIRDISQTPHEIHGHMPETELQVIERNPETRTEPKYIILLSNRITHREKFLLRRLILELTKVKTHQASPKSLNNITTMSPYFIMAIYLGFGLILCDEMIDVGTSYVAGWQSTWRNKAEVPLPVAIYALALFAKESGNSNALEAKLPKIQAAQFKSDLLLTEQPIVAEEPTEEDELQQSINTARTCLKAKQFSQAIEGYEKALSLVNDQTVALQLYINAAYSYLRLKEYDKALNYYTKALEIKPNYGYALNNMGYIYIMQGNYTKAKECLEQTPTNDNVLFPYSLRNWALYYMKQADYNKAEQYFQHAFELNKPIDLLEFYYYEFLTLQGEKEEAMNYLIQSANKGEPEGIEELNKMES